MSQCSWKRRQQAGRRRVTRRSCCPPAAALAPGYRQARPTPTPHPGPAQSVVTSEQVHWLLQMQRAAAQRPHRGARAPRHLRLQQRHKRLKQALGQRAVQDPLAVPERHGPKVGCNGRLGAASVLQPREWDGGDGGGLLAQPHATAMPKPSSGPACEHAQRVCTFAGHLAALSHHGFVRLGRWAGWSVRCAIT